MLGNWLRFLCPKDDRDKIIVSQRASIMALTSDVGNLKNRLASTKAELLKAKRDCDLCAERLRVCQESNKELRQDRDVAEERAQLLEDRQERGLAALRNIRTIISSHLQGWSESSPPPSGPPAPAEAACEAGPEPG